MTQSENPHNFTVRVCSNSIIIPNIQNNTNIYKHHGSPTSVVKPYRIKVRAGACITKQDFGLAR